MSLISRVSTNEPGTLQQEIAALSAMPEVQSAVEWFRAQENRLAQWQMDAASIPAPPFGEQKRAEWLAGQFRSLGLTRAGIDSIGNVIGLLRQPTSDSSTASPDASVPASVISVSAHIDTVFPAGSPVEIRQEGRKLCGPGISDNAAGIAALLAVVAVIREFRIPHATPILFIGDVGEEGEGDLRGMRHIFTESEWKNSIEACVVIDGAGSDTVIARALGSRRFEITVRGPGGHSWSDFGAPNPIVALARAIHLFSQTRVTTSPKTTFNVGVISGGTSVNSIPESASMRVDIRSASGMEIERLEMELRRAVEQAMAEEESRAANGASQRTRTELQAEIRAIGNRPAAELDGNARILQIARAVDAHLGNSAQVQRASTDANIPLAMGREAIALGAGGQGGGAHTLQEWFDPAGRELGLQRILLIVLALAGTAPAGAGQ
jgi:tripeptide aminopeptidase